MKYLAFLAGVALLGMGAANAQWKTKKAGQSGSKWKPAATSSQSGSDKKAAEEATANTVILEVAGMKWGASCAKKVQSALAKVEGVESATVTMPGKAEVVGTASAEVLIAAVEGAGFKAECPECDKGSAAKTVEATADAAKGSAAKKADAAKGSAAKAVAPTVTE